MKLVHLWLLIFLTSTSPAVTQAFGPNWLTKSRIAPRFFRTATSVETVFRGQSAVDDVPLPPNAVAPNAAIPSGPASPFAVPEFSYPAPGPGMPPAPVPGIPIGQTVQSSPGLSVPAAGAAPSTWNAFSPPAYTDPFVGGAGGASPYAPYSPYGAPAAAPYSGGFSSPGANGPTPYRMGWHTDLDIEWLAHSGTSGSVGGFGQFGMDLDVGYTGPFMPGWMLTWTNEFRLRNWDGPEGGTGLPGKAFRFGWDFELETPQTGPVSYKLGLTPSINSDLDGSLGKTAFQLDGKAMMILQLDQYWSMVLGAGYWDRVDDRVIPYVGLVYRDDFWEWRIMYPETTVSLFLGNEAQWAKWMYMRAEYHVESYEVRTSGGVRDEAELEDYRILFGFRMDAGMYSWFTEGGWVFDRTVDFGIPSRGSFSPNKSFIARIGWRY